MYVACGSLPPQATHANSKINPGANENTGEAVRLFVPAGQVGSPTAKNPVGPRSVFAGS
jgi:hypothetical protein